MITNNFYPTAITDSIGDIQYTADLIEIEQQNEDIAAPYYMGYIDTKDMASVAKLSSFIVSTDSESSNYGIEFKSEVPEDTYIPWFFVSNRLTSGVGQQNTLHLMYNENDGWSKILVPYGGKENNVYFLNNFDIQTTETYSFSINISYFQDYSPRTNTHGFTQRNYSKSFLNSIDLYNFLYNDDEITFNIYSSSTMEPQSIDITLKLSDFDTTNGTCYKEWEVYDTQKSLSQTLSCLFFISRIEWNLGRNSNSSGEVGNYCNVSVAYKYNNIISVLGGGYYWGGSISGVSYIRINSSTFLPNTNDIKTITIEDKNYIPGGFVGKIEGDFITSAELYSIYYGENFICLKSSGSLCSLQRILKPEEIIKTVEQLGLIIKNHNDTDYGFSSNYQIQIYNNDNSPAWELVHADLSEIEDRLQPWQYTNIIYNTFTEEDIPPYKTNDFEERDLEELNPSIQDFINKFIDGRAGTVNSFESSRMES